MVKIHRNFRLTLGHVATDISEAGIFGKGCGDLVGCLLQ